MSARPPKWACLRGSAYALRTIAGLRRDGCNNGRRVGGRLQKYGRGYVRRGRPVRHTLPLAIDIAGYIKNRRGAGCSPFARKVAATVAGNFGMVESAAAGMLTLGAGLHTLMGHRLAELPAVSPGLSWA